MTLRMTPNLPSGSAASFHGLQLQSNEEANTIAMKAENFYYFTAYYDDGTQYEQGADDLSIQETGKNAYYDVFYNPIKPLESLRQFSLLPANGEGPVFSVNLGDGHFEVGGISFFPYPAHREKYSDLRLIYYRVNEASITLQGGEKIGEGLKVLGYVIGFQANDEQGKNVQHIMRI